MANLVNEVSSYAGKTILVAEDNFLVGISLRDWLTDAGLRVLGPIATAKQASHLAATAEFDAAILDINLADGDAFEAALLVSARNLPLVFLSGYADLEVPGPLIAFPRLIKPFEPDDLQRSLDSVLALSATHASKNGFADAPRGHTAA